jgi:hypothetical protein
MQTKWLNCTISEGLFTGEYAVKGQLSNSIGFSLFALEQYIRLDTPLEGRQAVNGCISVSVLDEKDDEALVSLPQPTFENGQTITVKRNQVRP